MKPYLSGTVSVVDPLWLALLIIDSASSLSSSTAVFKGVTAIMYKFEYTSATWFTIKILHPRKKYVKTCLQLLTIIKIKPESLTNNWRLECKQTAHFTLRGVLLQILCDGHNCWHCLSKSHYFGVRFCSAVRAKKNFFLSTDSSLVYTLRQAINHFGRNVVHTQKQIRRRRTLSLTICGSQLDAFLAFVPTGGAVDAPKKNYFHKQICTQ